MFAAALAMAMTCPKKRRLDLEPHAAAKTTTSNHFFHELLLRGCGDVMKNSGQLSVWSSVNLQYKKDDRHS
jgi:hypothetical protein